MTVAFATDGVVTRIKDVGTSDKLLYIITPDRGRIAVMVKGGRSPSNKNTPVSQLFTYGNFEINKSNSMYWLRSGSVIEPFYDLSKDIERVALASYLCDLSNELTDEDVFELRKTVGMVFQNPDNQLVATIVEDDVAFGPENLGVPSAEIRQRVDKALTDVGMSEYAKHEPHRLSGGQKQRVAIAGVIAMMPECIIFDESTAMLDPLGRHDVMDSIIKLNREKGITVIMITHYMDEAAMADRIVVLNDGEVLLDGSPEYVFEQEALLRSCGLAIPQSTELVHRLREAGIDLTGDCASLDECAKLIIESLKKV